MVVECGKISYNIIIVKTNMGGENMGRKGPVEFKGKLNGLFLNVSDGAAYDAVKAYLEKLSSTAGGFYKGAHVAGLNGIQLSYREKAEIETVLMDRFQMTVESLEPVVETMADAVVKTADSSETFSEPEAKEKEPVPEIITEPVIQAVEPESVFVQAEMPAPERLSDTRFVFGTLRSGKSVEHPGHVVIVGDINPGAEVVAEGNIIVMGRVLGFVHAGSAGDDSAIVVANVLKPTQIRISKYISVPPQDDESFGNGVPEQAYVEDGIIRIEKCH